MGEDEALAGLREILARPEYTVDQSAPWWDQVFGSVLGVVGYLLARVVQALADAVNGHQGPLGIGIVGVCALLVGGVVVYLVRSIRLAVVRESHSTVTSLAERRERSERLWQSAQRLAAAGQLAEGVRLLYLSALYALDERALLHVQSSQTNREHARQLSRTHPDVGRTFSEVVDRYDRARYGRFPITETTFTELSGLVDRARRTSLEGATA